MYLLNIVTIPELLTHGKCKPLLAIMDVNGCFHCISHSLKDGDYPQIVRDGKYSLAHRAVFEIFHGPIPEGMLVRHTCNNTICINPTHLILGTQWDNMQDKIKAGRQPRGSQIPGAKLNEETVYYIKFVSTETNEELASKYEVNTSTINNARINKTWKHVTSDFKLGDVT